MLVLAGCGAGAGPKPIAPSAQGPPNVVRVALTDFSWPVDPALARTRDDTLLARTLYPTALRIDPVTGAPAAGLCSGWAATDGFRAWTFTCHSAPAIAAALHRVQSLQGAPLRWLFAGARIDAPSANRLAVRLPFAWRRFPYALTTVASAPRSVPGPFHLVSGSADQLVARSPRLTLLFHRYTQRAAERAFERGDVDEAPVPVGDVVGTRARLGSVVQTRSLLALDGVALPRLAPALRRVYWDTANRGDYADLVTEARGAAASSVVAAAKKVPPRAYRNALNAIGTLPRVRVRIGVPDDPGLRTGARLLYGDWRDIGLGPLLVGEGAPRLDGSFDRWAAPYPQAEALPAELALRDRLGPRGLLLRALAAGDQRAALARFDADLRASARFVPVAWAVDARLVSPRLRGWREDALGDVDYSLVRSLASSRRP